jgi:acetyl esterase/lipase
MKGLARREALAAALGATMIAGRGQGQGQAHAPGAAEVAPPPAGSPRSLPDPDETIELWPRGAPGMPARPPVERIVERSRDPGYTDRAIMGVVRPRLIVFRPAVPNGAGLLVAPGGGYVRMAIDKEGYEMGRFLSARGYTVFVLFYRLPGDGWAAGPDVALQDAQRAMRTIRARAAAYRLDPAKIGAMGFSAGGHLCADLLTRHDARIYDPVDEIDRQSARPVIAAPIYPVVSLSVPLAHGGSRTQLLGAEPTPAREEMHSPDRQVRAGCPPVFLCAAEDDTVVPVENSLMLHAALRAAKVPVEMHLFAHGGHGFGIAGVRGKPAAIWPDLFLAWARTQEFG